MSALTVIEKHRQTLSTVLNQNRDYVHSVIPIDKEDEFKNNFLELAQNGYLMDKIPAKEVLITALNATKLGLNVNPIYKELYVLPFNVKGRGMVASIVIPKQGHAQIAFDSGFFLDISLVFNMGGKVVSEKEMTREQKASIDTTNPTWVDEHLLGWDISLEDISGNDIKVPTQTKFIEVAYAREVTKELQSPQYKIQTWTHKAVRRAMGDMFIPKQRKNMMLEYVEAFNIQNDTGAPEAKAEPETSKTTTTVDLKTTKLEPEVIEAEVEEITTKTIMGYYQTADKDKQAEIAKIMATKSDWRDYNAEDLALLYEEIKAI